MSALGEDLDGLADAPPPERGRWHCDETPDGAEITTPYIATNHQDHTDWAWLLAHFNLDPACFEVEGNSVRISKWQQSARAKAGDRDMVWLYSYRARFRRITAALPEADVEAVLESVRKWRPLVRKTPGAGAGAPATMWVGWADWQAYKGDADVLADRVHSSVEQTVARVKELRRVGRNVESLAVGNMGDPFEGCYGNYDSQLFTVGGTKRQQLNLVLELWATGLRALAPLFDDVLFVSVLSNHSEWTRGTAAGSKPVTSDSDNADGFLAETLRRVLGQRDDMGHVRWSIPHDEMVSTEELSGVRVGFTHGHKMPGSKGEMDWLRAQSIRLLRDAGAEPRLWMTAHRHHLDVRDFGSFHRIQHPTLEVAPSKWYTDATGLWSTPGTLTCLVGEHDQAGGELAGGGIGWSDLAVLPVRAA